jgi:tripartite-type tricarboxylate transporter receptor subunit TctC
MVVVASPFVSNSFVYDTVPYDPIKDFDPVTLSLTNPVMLSVNPSLPAQTVKDLVALIRANPDKYSYASAATGTRTYFISESFKQSLNLDLVHVPFNGGGLAVVSVLAGHTPVFFSTPPPVVQHIKEGALRALAVMSKARSQILPDVPTIAEAGYPDSRARNGWASWSPPERPKR